MASKKYAVIGKNCVACGCCVKVCPRDAVSIWKGVKAVVDTEMCVGCGKCAADCPAGAVTTVLREGQQ